MSKKVKKNTDNTAANVSLITKVLLFLYLVVSLSPKVVEIEYEGFQWFYFSVLNILSLLFIFFQRDYLKPFSIDKKAKQLLMIFIGLLVISIASVTQSLNVSESVVHLMRLFNVIAAVYSFYILFRKNPKSFFEFIAKVCTILMIYYSIITMEHFIGNYTKPRTVELYKTFLHYFGNINFFTAALILKIPFAIYLILKGNTFWKFISYIAVFTTVLSLMFSGSRTAMLSLVIILILLVVYLLFNLKENKKERVFQVSYFVLLPFLAIFIFSNTNKVDKRKSNTVSDIFIFKQNDYKELGSLKKENAKLFSTNVVVKEDETTLDKLLAKSGRGHIWPAAIETFVQNPILGVGYGNYKVHPKPRYFKEKTNFKGNYSISIRAHNDFLEKYIEIGFIGGTLYVLIFVFILILMIKLFRKGNNKEVVLLLFLSGIAFTLDSFFNFPTERIPIYIFFILIISLILGVNYTDNNKDPILEKETEPQKIAYYLLVTLLIVSCGLNYMVYKAYQENTIFKNQKEFKRRKYNLTYEGFKNRVSSFPNLDQDAIKMGYYLASYASLEKKYKESMSEINNNIDAQNTAQNYILKKLKAEIFLKAYKKIDSAEFYYRENFEKFPSYKQNYSMLKNIYTATKETDKLEALMDSYTSQNSVDDAEWVYKANYYYKKNRIPKLPLKILDTGLAYAPNSLNIVKAKQELSKHKTINNYYKAEKTKGKYSDAIALYNKTKYKDALAIFYSLIKENPNDFYAIQYVGITEMNLKNYGTAIEYLTKTIVKKIFKDGKAEFCRGFCYEKSGNIEASKKDYRASRAKKFPRALSLAKKKYE